MLTAEIYNGRVNELTFALAVSRELLSADFVSSFILTFQHPETGNVVAYDSADLGGLGTRHIFDNTDTQAVFDPWRQITVEVQVVKILAGQLGVAPGRGYVCTLIAVDPVRTDGVVFDTFYANVYADVMP